MIKTREKKLLTISHYIAVIGIQFYFKKRVAERVAG